MMADRPPTSDRERTRSGFGRVLIALYAVFTLAALARSAVQIIDRFEVAPVAFVLSGVAGLIYLLATVLLVRGDAGSRRLAAVSMIVEFAGVLVIGTVSLLVTRLFPEPTVWSHFGQGYGFIPVVLPLVGLWWLRRSRAEPTAPDR